MKQSPVKERYPNLRCVLFLFCSVLLAAVRNLLGYLGLANATLIMYLLRTSAREERDTIDSIPLLSLFDTTALLLSEIWVILSVCPLCFMYVCQLSQTSP